MRTITCYRCKMLFGIPEEFYQTAKQMAEDMTWYCPAGHGQVFRAGESDIDKLRRERDLLKQQLAAKDEEINWQRNAREAAERSASARKGQITKLKKRATAGLCPCCNRSFQNLHRHMTSQHPKYMAEEVE